MKKNKPIINSLNGEIISSLKTIEDYDKEFADLSIEFLKIYTEHKEDKKEDPEIKEKLISINTRMSEINILAPIRKQFDEMMKDNKKESK